MKRKNQCFYSSFSYDEDSGRENARDLRTDDPKYIYANTCTTRYKMINFCSQSDNTLKKISTYKFNPMDVTPLHFKSH